jgi:Protein of unknown function (DUF3592)
LIRLSIYLFRVAQAWLRGIRSKKWPVAEAMVTADLARDATLTHSVVEVPYTYRFQGELYTGLHEEPSFGGAGSKFMQRFAKGRRFVVRVNPADPEVSIMRDEDQSDDIQQHLAIADELRNRDVAHQ